MKEQYQKIKEYFQNIFARDALGYVPHNVIQSWFFATVMGGSIVVLLFAVGVYAFFFLGDESIVPDATPSVSTSFSQERLKKIVSYYNTQDEYFAEIRSTTPSAPDTGTLNQMEDEEIEEVEEQAGEQGTSTPEM